MDTILSIVRQEEIEKKYNRKHIDGYIREELLASDFMKAKIEQGVKLLTTYANKVYYDSKNARIAPLKSMDLKELILDLFVGIAYFQVEELLTSATAQLAGRIGFSDRKEAITTVAEMLAVLCETDAFDISKASKYSSLMLVSRIPLSDKLVEFVLNSQYLPPMVCLPLELKNNYSSGYLSHKDSLILGSGNHHDGDICLDVLNIMNSVPLKLDTKFLSKVEEDPNTEFTVEKVIDKAAEKGEYLTEGQAKEIVAKQREQWMVFKRQSYEFYALMAKLGNRFYLTNKYDKRGRAYAQGYHITTQGTSFKKAMLELADEELIEGVPM